MKKLNLLLVIAILVTALIAQVIPAKLIRLEVYNWTGENVYMRLEGVTTGQFYYLTVPPTTRANWYNPKVYTIMTDYYSRPTWACGGVETSGQLRIVKNFRMNFTACGTLPLRRVWYDWYFHPNRPDNAEAFEIFKAPNFGEPTMEKVVFFSVISNKVWVKIPIGTHFLNPNTSDGYNRNLWFLTTFGDPLAVVGAPQDTGVGWGVDFQLQDYCSPNNCFVRINFNHFTGAFGAFSGPGAANRFRYRY